MEVAERERSAESMEMAWNKDTGDATLVWKPGGCTHTIKHTLPNGLGARCTCWTRSEILFGNKPDNTLTTGLIDGCINYAQTEGTQSSVVVGCWQYLLWVVTNCGVPMQKGRAGPSWCDNNCVCSGLHNDCLNYCINNCPSLWH